jgi:hypothetical protein
MLLVVPGERFRAPLRLDDPELREAYDQGVRDAAARSTRERPVTVSAEELDRVATLGGEARRAYWLAARREPIRAPAPLGLHVALLALEAFVAVRAANIQGLRRKLVEGPPLLALVAFGELARKRIEQRRAREIGLSHTTAPQPIVSAPTFLLALVVVPCRLYRRHRDGRVQREEWPLMLARTLVERIVARRSWQRALRGGS